MERMILKGFITSILSLSLAMNGNISFASSQGTAIPVLNEDEEKNLGEEEDISSKLVTMLSDPSRQNRIEIKIIKKLQEIDTNSTFSKVFYEVLSSCEGTRKASYYHGKEIPSNEANESNFCFLSVLAKDCSQISWALKNELYNPDPQARRKTLNMIRVLSDMENEFGVQYKTFFERLNQIFYHSKQFLAVTIAPQIIEKYGITGINEDEFKYSTVKYTEEIATEKNIEEESSIDPDSKKSTSATVQVCEFQKDGTNYACLFREKQAGIHFGALIGIGVTRGKDEEGLPVIEDNNRKVYYLKAYHGYPAMKEKHGSDAYTDSTTTVTTTPSEPRGLRAQELNIKEPFVYKLLENLQVGPVVHFMINPYINNGFYIATEDLNTDTVGFVELNQLKLIFGDILRSQTLDAGQLKMKTNLAEINLLTNILELGDIKPDNIGYIFTQDNEETPVDLSKAQIKIIDFLNKSGKETDVTSNFMCKDMFVSPEAGGVFS